MTRKPSLVTFGLWTLFTLGFVAGIYAAILNPGVAEIMSYAAAACGVLSVAMFVAMLVEAR